MSRLGAKTYSRKPECRTSIQFDHLLSDKGNKPSTAKVSVAGVHRWGMTSFTSLRKTRINGQKEVSETVEPVKRAKLDTSSTLDDPFSFETDIENPSSKNIHSSGISASDKKPPAPKPNKFFKSGSSRLLTPVSNSPKNSDFDALRLSVSSNHKTKKEPQEIFLNMQTNYKSDVTHDSNEQSVFLSNTSPNIVDLRYCSNVPNSVNSCASTNYSNKTSVHYISPFIQPLIATDSSSKAFDALRTLDLTNKSSFSDNCFPFETVANVTDNSVKLERTYDPQKDASVINNDGIFMQNISQNFGNKPSVQEACDSVEQPPVSSYGSQKENLFEDSCQQELHFESKCDSGNSQENVPSQSTDKSDDTNSATKHSSRPKKIFSSSLKV